MALPAGALSATVTVSLPLDLAGVVGTIEDFSVYAECPLVWAATGDAFPAWSATGSGSLTILADQPGVLTSGTVDGAAAMVEVRGWPLIATWRPVKGTTPGRREMRRFSSALLTPGATVDLDLLPADGALPPMSVTYAQSITWATDATMGAKGTVQLAGDIGGTALAPTVTGGAHHGHTAAQVSDSTPAGRAQLTAADEAAQRLALGVEQLRQSPRGGRRLPLERRPTLAVGRTFPNAYTDYRIIYADDTIVWSFGHDFALRYSLDGGVMWGTKTASGGASTVWGMRGLFFKTASGVYLTASQPAAGGDPKIIRSANGGVTWTDSVAAQTGVGYLGPTSIAQDPVTGYLYLAEYVAGTVAANPTWKIIKSTDDGATWTTFRTFQRDAAAHPTTAVRHGHAIQWDPVGLRMWFLCGDAEGAAGLYRLNAGGTDVEPVVTNAQVDTASGIYAGAVGLMFFPNYIAWGVDQRSDSGLVRMARDQIGQASPVVTKVCDLQSTAFYTQRLDMGNTAWLMTVSDENGGGGGLDPANHVYRVADDGATCDEVLTVPTARTDWWSWLYFLGSDPLRVLGGSAVWIGTDMANITSDGMDPAVPGFQVAARLVWSAGATLVNPRTQHPKPSYLQETVNWCGSLTTSQATVFAADEVPWNGGPRRLYILNAHVEKVSGSGTLAVEVYNQTTGAVVKMENNITDLTFTFRSQSGIRGEDFAPYQHRSVKMTSGNVMRFRVRETGGTAGVDGVASITYAWGF